MASSVKRGMESPEWRSANTSSQLYAVSATIMFLCTILLALRLYARTLTQGTRGWDDFLLIPSWVLLMGVCILMFVAIPRAGIGRHLPVVLEEDPHTIVTWNIVIYVLDWFYVPSNMLSRLSVVSLYLRIFSKQRTWYFCWAVIVFLVCNCVAFIITANLECIPLRRTWDKSVPGKCFNIELWWKLSNPPNIIADVAILLLPLGKVWKLKATRTKKIGIGFVCLTGSIGLFASCMRTASFFVALKTRPPDPTWTSSSLLVWTVVECGMYNAAACLICLRPLYGKLPRYVRKRLGLQLSRKSTNPERKYDGVTTIGSRKRDKSWIRMDLGDTHSTVDIMQTQGTEGIEDIELSEPDPTKTSSIVPAFDSIRVERTFDITSTVASEQNPLPFNAGFR